MSLRRLVPAACAGLLTVLLSGMALAQEDDIEVAIGESRSSAAIRELQAQAKAELPRTDDRHEIAIFYHQRGWANFRLGNYDRAVGAAVDPRCLRGLARADGFERRGT